MRASWIGLVFAVACVDAQAPVSPEDDTPFEIEVPAGATGRSIGPMLLEQGLIPGAWTWRWYLRSADASCLKAGRFSVHRSLSMEGLLTTLCGPPLADDIPFTVVEGWRIRDIDQGLTQLGLIEAGAYITAANVSAVTAPFEIPGDSLEGYLYPETYKVDPKQFKVGPFIERQLATFQARFGASYVQPPGGRSLHDIVVMASMLEREERDPNNRPTVAGILWKRIDNGWNLGVDATSRYTLADWNNRQQFMLKLRDPNEPYNTRLRPGLPPTAIGNPSVESLRAAAAPVASEWWYYLHDPKGQFHGARDVAGHEANRRMYNVY